MALQAFIRLHQFNNALRAIRRERVFRDRTNPFDVYDDFEFKRRFRFTKDTVHFIHDLIKDKIERPTKRGRALTSQMQLFIALRYYATGSFQLTVGDLCSASQPSVSKTIKQVSIALAELKPDYIKFPDDFRSTKQEFYDMAEFPNVIGAIDGVHIKIVNPGGIEAARFINRKNFFSINTQVICDSRGKIINIVARWPGSAHDSRIFNESRVKQKFENRELPGILLGDQGYACMPYLMTPLSNPVTRAEKSYNKSHVKTRGIVERCFGIWKRRFPELKTGIRTRLETSFIIIIAVAVLQAIGFERNDNADIDDDDFQDANDDDDQAYNLIRNAAGTQARRQLIDTHFAMLN